MSIIGGEGARRLDAATGIGFAVLAFVGLSVQGKPPRADDSIETIRSFFEQRGAILAGDFLIGLACALFLWFLGSVRSYLSAHEGGDARLAHVAIGGGLVGTARILASTPKERAARRNSSGLTPVMRP